MIGGGKHLLVYSANVVGLFIDLITVDDTTELSKSNDDRLPNVGVFTLLYTSIYSFTDISRQFTGHRTTSRDPDV